MVVGGSRHIEWRTEQRTIDDLVPYPDNPRKLTEKQLTDLKASLEKFNLAEIPAINTDNTIIAGHQRLRIMQMLGRGNEVIDVRVPNEALTEDEVREYNIRSNKNMGEWDWDMLANRFEIDDLISWGFQSWEFEIRGDGDLFDDREPEQAKNYTAPVVIEVDRDVWVAYERSIRDALLPFQVTIKGAGK